MARAGLVVGSGREPSRIRYRGAKTPQSRGRKEREGGVVAFVLAMGLTKPVPVVAPPWIPAGIGLAVFASASARS